MFAWRCKPSTVLFFVLVVCGSAAQAKELRDPTTPLHQAPRAESHVDLVLSAIADVGDRRFAIVNDRRVYQGDAVGGAVIEKINEGSVVYSHKGKRYTLKMRLSLIE